MFSVLSSLNTWLNPLSELNRNKTSKTDTLIGKIQEGYKKRYEKLGVIGKTFELVKDIVKAGAWSISKLFEVKTTQDEILRSVNTDEKSERNVSMDKTQIASNTSAEKSAEPATENPYDVISNGPARDQLELEGKGRIMPMINQYRRKINPELPSLEFSVDLCTSAKEELMKGITKESWRKKPDHSEEMQQHPSIGEVLTVGFETLEEAIGNFINSPLHRWYLLRGFTKMGYAMTQGVDGKRYLIVHFGGGVAEKKPETFEKATQEEIDAFGEAGKTDARSYWEAKAKELNKIPNGFETELSKKFQPERLKVLLACLEAQRSKLDPDVVINLDGSRIGDQSTIPILMKKGAKSVKAKLSTRYSSVIFVDESQKKDYAVAFDKALSHFNSIPA